MINQNNVYAVIAGITPGILQFLVDDKNISINEATRLLYNSGLYQKLEDVGTGLWRLSPLALYDLLSEELLTGTIQNWPEEQ